ncbi:cuticle protein 7-like [Cloeon dipterum]|uniref:cuticle protein 7-like n=1 Tax=Cloeon dipterum TaxID=197152 RepID=UPI0032204200
MALLKVSFVALAFVAAVVAEPPPNSYLPPTTGGYNYNKPSPAFQPTRPATFTPPPPPPPSSFRPPAPAPSYGPPTGPSNVRPVTLNPPSHDHDHHEPGMPFDFNYAVKDDYYGTDFAHNAVSDGDVVRGEYRVLLPDGRTQIVRYTADWKNGYNAEVTYEGTASYPQPAATNLNNQYGPPKTGY